MKKPLARPISKFGNSSRAASLHLVGGVCCLDFTNTASGRGGAHYLEHLQEPQHVVAWALHAGVINAGQARRLSILHPATARKLLQRATRLREALQTLGEAAAHGRNPPRASLGVLASVHAANLQAAELHQHDRQLQWRWNATDENGSGILGPVTVSAIALLGSENAVRVKQCAGEGCGWLFLDTSKNGNRRWCDMQVCGNRAKLRAFRLRQPKGGKQP